MREAAEQFLSRASQIMAQRNEDAKIKVNRLNKIEPVKDEIWSGKAKDDLELTTIFKELVQSLREAIEEETSFGFFPMGKKLILIERFLQQYISLFSSDSPVYGEKAQDRIYAKLSEIFEVLGIPKEVLVKLWMDAT